MLIAHLIRWTRRHPQIPVYGLTRFQWSTQTFGPDRKLCGDFEIDTGISGKECESLHWTLARRCVSSNVENDWRERGWGVHEIKTSGEDGAWSVMQSWLRGQCPGAFCTWCHMKLVQYSELCPKFTLFLFSELMFKLDWIFAQTMLSRASTQGWARGLLPPRRRVPGGGGGGVKMEASLFLPCSPLQRRTEPQRNLWHRTFRGVPVKKVTL